MQARALRVGLQGTCLTRQIVWKSQCKTVSTAAAAQLKVFPEFASATQLERSGNYGQAVPLYQRMHEVLSGAMGKTAAVSVELACHTAKLQSVQGEYSKAVKILTDSIAGAESKVALVRYHLLLAEVHLLSGDRESAYNVAIVAKDAVEAHSESAYDTDDELALFSPTYGLLGG
jgi:hypothetical protein